MRVIVALIMAAVAFAKLEVLTTSEYQSKVAEGNWFIKFYAPWCGHCKRLAPTWDKLAEEIEGSALAEKNVHIAKVDCTVEKDLCNANNIKGYPTLMFFKEGNKEGIRYSGGRDIPAFKSFLEAQTA